MNTPGIGVDPGPLYVRTCSNNDLVILAVSHREHTAERAFNFDTGTINTKSKPKAKDNGKVQFCEENFDEVTNTVLLTNNYYLCSGEGTGKPLDLNTLTNKFMDNQDCRNYAANNEYLSDEDTGKSFDIASTTTKLKASHNWRNQYYSGLRWRITELSPLSFLFVVICLLLALPRSTLSQSTQPSFLQTPTNASQVLGGNVTLECQVDNLGTRSIAWTQIRGGFSKLLYLNDQAFQADARYKVLGSPSGFDLVLSNLQTADDAEYACAVQNSALQASATVTVLVPPDEPVITLNKMDDQLYEGDSIVLNCSSSGGNLPPNITWFRGTQRITTSASLLKPSYKFGTTTSLLTWSLTRNDHLMNFTCSAENNELINSRVSSEIRLNVKYAPVISVGQFNPLISVVNTSVSMTCTADANPPVDPSTGVSWMRNNETLVSGARLSIQFVQLEDAGQYVCIARNYANKSASLTLKVQYPPRVSITSPNANLTSTSVAVVNQGSDVTLLCSADSGPSQDPATLRWYRAGDQTVIHQGAELELKAVTRTNNDVIYRCEAEAVLTPSIGSPLTVVEQAYVKLAVYYIPGPARIFLSTDPVVVGTNVTMWCNASDLGNPPATLQWTESGSKTSTVSGSQLSLLPVGLTDSGNYTCRASNVVGQGPADTRWLDVFEPPTLLSATNLTLVRRVGDTMQALICTVRGKPAPEITWYKDGVPITAADQKWYTVNTEPPLLQDVYSRSVRSTLTFTGLLRVSQNSTQREDSGIFSCQASSTVGRPLVVQLLNLQVQYTPVLSNPIYPIGVDIGDSISLPCFASANPEPTFTWKRENVMLANGGRFQISEAERVDGKDSFLSMLNISAVSLVDIESAYSCQVTNSLGSETMRFNLTLRTVPEIPKTLAVVSYTWESAQLIWVPGFDGGYTQTFVINCLNRNSEFSVNFTLPSGLQNSANISGLFPGQQYQCSVRAVNRLGNSNSSNSVTITTNEFTLPLLQSVQYDSKTRNLTFQSIPSLSADSTCLRYYVHYQGTSEAQVSPDCQPVVEGERVWWSTLGNVDGSREVKGVEASLCLKRRMDVCGGQQTAAFLSEHDVPVKTIIIVVCVCGGVVLILSIILIALCCRRYYNRKYMKQSTATIALQPVLSHEHGGSIPKHPPIHGFDNPAVVGYDNDMNDKLDLTRNPYGQFHPTAAKGVYILDPDDDHITSNGGSTSSHNVDGSSNSSDSGVSTNEAQKPKRIIYEIVV